MFDKIKNCLIIVFLLVGIFSFINFLFYTCIKLDETKINETRFCPSCGLNLVTGR